LRLESGDREKDGGKAAITPQQPKARERWSGLPQAARKGAATGRLASQSGAATSDAQRGWDAGAVATALRCRVRVAPREARKYLALARIHASAE